MVMVCGVICLLAVVIVSNRAMLLHCVLDFSGVASALLICHSSSPNLKQLSTFSTVLPLFRHQSQLLIEGVVEEDSLTNMSHQLLD